MLAGASRIANDTSHLVNYFESDGGVIQLHLDQKLPGHTAMAEPDFVKTLLVNAKNALSDQSNSMRTIIPYVTEMDIVCHTGGPRVLKMVAQSLGATEENMVSSWEVMTSHGNQSGASNLAVLNHHNLQPKRKSEWAVCLSMGPGACLEGLILRDARRWSYPGIQLSTMHHLSTLHPVPEAVSCPSTLKKVVHIVGGGIAGLTLAAALDPKKFDVRVFESSPVVKEQGYGIAVWPSMIKILRDEMGVTDLNFATAKSMTVRPVGNKLDVAIGEAHPDKGFMKRSHLLERIKARLQEQHPNCISTNHTCTRVRFHDDGSVKTTYEVCDMGGNSRTAIYSCDLLVGADGVNSSVRKYVALENDTKSFGHMTAYRFLVPHPSKVLCQETKTTWNINIGSHIHSPCYRISSEGEGLNVVVLEYDGKPPGGPRTPSHEELMDVAVRSGLPFIIKMLQEEEISDLKCYSTYHVDCKPWVQAPAVIIGDAAHAFGPLTAKMANLAINDAFTLGKMLNDNSSSLIHEQGIMKNVLEDWEAVQRLKFNVTRTHTLRHLQLYSPQFRGLTAFL
jgi:salicylate hydroxylase